MKLLSFKEMQLSFRLCHPTHTTPYGFAKQPLPCAYITVSRYVRGRVGQQHRTQKKKKKEEQLSESPRVSPLLLSILRIYPAIVYTAHTHRHGHTFNTITRESPGVITRLDSRLLCPWTKRKKAKPSYIEEIKGLYFWLLDLKKKKEKVNYSPKPMIKHYPHSNVGRRSGQRLSSLCCTSLPLLYVQEHLLGSYK